MIVVFVVFARLAGVRPCGIRQQKCDVAEMHSME
jgi:hypothetical protein